MADTITGRHIVPESAVHDAQDGRRHLRERAVPHLNYALDGQTCGDGLKTEEEIARDAMGAYFLMWPLAATLKVEILPGAQRKWIKERMQSFSDMYDYTHAGKMSHCNDCADSVT